MSILIFDFDGTLCNSLDLTVDIINRHSTKKVTREKIRSLSLKELVQYLGISYFELPKLVFRMHKYFKLNMLNQNLVGCMDKVLSSLYRANHKMYIVSSNSKANILKWLQHKNVEQYFAGIYDSPALFGKHIVFH